MKHTYLLFWLGGVAALAQEPAMIHERKIIVNTAGEIGAAGMQEMKFMAEEFSMDHKVVTGAPYSASSVTETVQTLADGNHIRHSMKASVARDSQGRTRREQSLRGPASLGGDLQLPTLVFIQDPVTQTGYVLEADTKIARSTPFGGKMISPPAGSYQLKVQAGGAMKAPDVKKESLGSQTINGVRSEGNRLTRTIAAGEMGNEKAIEVVTETWYSAELQAVVRSKTSDPRTGETTFELQTIDRSEPLASLFTVPGDYTVQESKGTVTVMRRMESHQ